MDSRWKEEEEQKRRDLEQENAQPLSRAHMETSLHHRCNGEVPTAS